MTNNRSILIVACLLGALVLLNVAPASAGGPLAIFDPVTRTPFAWPGPVAVYTDNDPQFSFTGPVSGADGDARVADGFAEWTAVATSTFSASVVGDFASIGLPEINLSNIGLVLGTFNGGGYHIVYDSDGAITAAIAGPGVLGFSGPEFAFPGVPFLAESFAVLNGATVDPGDVTGSAWQGVFTHEFGHGINLAHTQTNGAIVFFGDGRGPGNCPLPYSPFLTLAETETMYPFLDPRIGGTGVEQGTVESLDDVASLSNIYPASGWPANFGTITGTIFRPDGSTEITGVNVIARNLADPFRDCNSALSGDFTQGDLGDDGLYTLNGLTPGAQYVIYIDGIVAGGFSTTPAALPGPEEFWNGANESGDPNTDDPCESFSITATAGSPFTASVISNPFIPDPALPGVCYASTGLGGASPGTLFIVDPATGVATAVGAIGAGRMPGLAINSLGDIYGATGGGTSQLIRISASDGQAASVGFIRDAATGAVLPFVDAIAFDASNVLYGLDGNNVLWTINANTGAATRVGFTTVTPAPFLVGMAFDPDTGKLYASTGGLGGADAIFEINPATGQATFVGNTGLGAGAIPDLHFADGTMYGSKNIGGVFNLITIDLTTGAGTAVGPFGGGLRISGLASFVASDVVVANLDIKPGSCPNPFNRALANTEPGADLIKQGVLPVAVVGSESFDVRQIDRSSIRLEGVAPLPIDGGISDVAKLVDDNSDCACTRKKRDGFDDLTAKFSAVDIAAAITIGEPGEELVLTLTGLLMDGTPFVARDCITFVGNAGKNEPPGQNAVITSPELKSAYPNPFNPITRLSYTLPERDFVRLTVFDVTGRVVARLVDETKAAGDHTLEWNASGIASGVYFYRLQTTGFVQTRRMILLK
ncbi:MAG: T9SS type A sorting domain-containing protein [Candidatus Krumholzibacteriota bacterium]|nr:T9SS type A sorting domain-containing protein [Candidatus Krumholzibacteriota bacterium]